MKKIIIHDPNISINTLIGQFLHRFYDALDKSLQRIGVDYVVEMEKNKELRRDENYNHFVYHTRRKRPNWLNVKMGYLSEFFYIDGEGYSGWSEIRHKKFDPALIDDEKSKTFKKELQRRYIDERLTKYHGLNDIEGEIPENHIAIFMQVYDDEVLKLQRASYEEILAGVIRNANGRPIVIKRHPLCKEQAADAFIEEARLLDNVIITKANIHDILPKSDMVVCVNSGVGFEALLYGKHVVTFGRCDYHHVTSELGRNGKIDDAFNQKPVSNEAIEKYLYWYLREQQFGLDDPDFDTRIEAKLRTVGWIE